ncbi:MAG TPA: BON domain-containing protein [Stenomitos sp.]
MSYSNRPDGSDFSKESDLQNHSDRPDAPINQDGIEERRLNHAVGYAERRQNAQIEDFDQRSQTNGLLIGGLVALVLGGLGFLYYLWNNNNQPAKTVIVSPAPTVPSTQPSSSINVTVASPEVIEVLPTTTQPTTANNRSAAQSPSVAPSPKESNQEVPRSIQPNSSNNRTSPNPSTDLASPISQVSPSTPADNQSATNNAGNSSKPTLIDDNQIQSEASNKINKLIPSNNLTIQVSQAKLTVSGELNSPEEIQQVTDQLQNIKGVKAVENKIVLRPRT